MKTTFLQTFLLTVDTGSMAEAARRLDLTPAAVAQQIRSLEQDLGVPLVSRAGKTVRPTEAGFRIMERSRALLRDAANLKSIANDGELTGELRIGAVNTALHSLMPEILARLFSAHPDLKVFIQSGLSSELFQAVQHGDLDAAVCLHPQFALPKTCAWQLLREEELVALVPLALADHDPHELLRTKPFIRYDRNQWGGQQADRYLRRAGIIPHERVELSYLGAIAMMVERGLGIALAPDTILPSGLGANIAKLPLPIRTRPRRLGILWLRSSIHGKLIKIFVEQAKISGC
jgi:DNA-binding transcriptional LysR family regulator